MSLFRYAKNFINSAKKRNITVAPHIFFDSEPITKNDPVVFLHGILGNKSNWKSIGRRMNKEHGYKCFSLDSRHHGDWKCNEPFDYFKMANDVKNFIDTIDIEKFHLVGHSMGGKTAMTFSQMYPEYLQTLTIIDIAPTIVRQAALINLYIDTIFSINIKNKSRNEVKKNLVEKLENGSLCDFIIMNLKTDPHGELSWVQNAQIFKKSFEDIASFPKFDKSYSGPTKFIVGEKSEYVNKTDYPSIKNLYSQADIVEVEGAGHMIHMEAQEKFIKILSEFLNDNSSGPYNPIGKLSM